MGGLPSNVLLYFRVVFFSTNVFNKIMQRMVARCRNTPPIGKAKPFYLDFMNSLQIDQVWFCKNFEILVNSFSWKLTEISLLRRLGDPNTVKAEYYDRALQILTYTDLFGLIRIY